LEGIPPDVCPPFGFASIRLLSNRASAATTQLLTGHLHRSWSDDGGQDIAEYAVRLAFILVIVVGTIRLIGSNADRALSAAASSIQ